MTLHTNIPNEYKQIPIIQIKRDEIIKKKIIEKKDVSPVPWKETPLDVVLIWLQKHAHMD